jgi:hypothetical protein
VKRLDVKRIANKTVELIKGSTVIWPTIPALDKTHCIHLMEMIIRGDIYGEQAHRFIGWVQAACTFVGIATMEDFRVLNRGCEASLQVGQHKEVLAQLLELEAIGKYTYFVTDSTNASKIFDSVNGAKRTIDNLHGQIIDLQEHISELEKRLKRYESA